MAERSPKKPRKPPLAKSARPEGAPHPSSHHSDRPLGDLATKLIRAGADAVQQTTDRIREREESFRPRELVAGAASLTARGKEELVTLVAKEVRGYMEKLRVGEELRSLMTEHSLEVSASFRLKPLTARERREKDASRDDEGDEAADGDDEHGHGADGGGDGTSRGDAGREAEEGSADNGGVDGDRDGAGD